MTETRVCEFQPEIESYLAEQLDLEKQGEQGFYRWALENQDNEQRDWKNDAIHVSDYTTALPLEKGGKAPIHLWKRYHGHEQEPDRPGEKLMFHQGNLLEDFTSYLLHQWCKENPDWEFVDVNTNVSDKLPAGDVGELDALLAYQGDPVPVEIKTRRGRSFKYRDGPRLSDTVQLRGYMGALGALNGLVIVVDREGSNFMTSYMIADDKPAFQVRKWSEYCNKIVRKPKQPDPIEPTFKRHSNKGPDRISLDIPWQAEYCDFVDCCEIADKFDGSSNILKVSDDGEITKVWDEFEGEEIVEKAHNLIQRGVL